MNSRRAALLVLPFLPSPASPPALARENKVEIGGTRYQFHPAKLVLSTPTDQMWGKRMFLLSGRLIPTIGQAIALELTALETGSIYLLKLTRPRMKGQDVWAATMKTKVEVLELHANPNGTLRLKLSGPLVVNLGKGGSITQWTGEIRARFDVISGRNETH